jgi:NADH:ubiquinone oxidoreductase subunit 3 (subunit A)
MLEQHLPLLLTAALAIGLGAVILVLSAWLGPKRRSAVKSESFECGNPSSGHARDRFAVKFFLVAILFLVFDIEAVFVYPWSVVLFDSTRGAIQQVHVAAGQLGLDAASLDAAVKAKAALAGASAVTPEQESAKKVLAWALTQDGFDWAAQSRLGPADTAGVTIAATDGDISKPSPLFVVLEMVVFVAIILVGLAYAWRKGALEWGPEKGRLDGEKTAA